MLLRLGGTSVLTWECGSEGLPLPEGTTGMTKLPHENRQVKGRSDFESPEFVQQCSHPFCSESRSLESHHIWRRSFLGGAYNHVELWDGTIVGNVTLLCRDHHREITEGKARIIWYKADPDSLKAFFWDYPNGTTFLNPQPPSGKNKTLSDSPVIQEEDEPTPYLTHYKPSETLTTPPVVVHGGKTFHLHTPKEGEECPTCKRKVPAKKKREPAKNRVSLTFRVPKDSQENGAEVLEDLIVEVEKLLYPESEPRPGYYTLCDGLGLVLVNKEIIL